MRPCIILHFSFIIGDSLEIPWEFPVTIHRISRDIPVLAGSRPVAVKGFYQSIIKYQTEPDKTIDVVVGMKK